MSELLHISDFSASFCCTIMFVFKVKDKAFVYRDDFLFEGVFLCHKHSVFKCLQFICYLGWHFFRLTRVAGLLCVLSGLCYVSFVKFVGHFHVHVPCFPKCHNKIGRASCRERV